MQILKTEIFGSVAIVGSLAEKSLFEYGARQSGDNMHIKRYDGLMELSKDSRDFQKYLGIEILETAIALLAVIEGATVVCLVREEFFSLN